MMRRLALIGLAMLSAAACGKSAEQQAAEDAAKELKQAADQMAKAGQQMAQGAAATAQQQVAQGMQQMAQGLQGMQANATVVDFEKLEALLPEYAGWEKSDAKGSQVSMGFKVSQAEARYTKGDSTIRLQIQDIALAQAMLAPLSIWMAAGYNERSSSGYKKAVTVAGHPGFEEWDKGSKHGAFTVVVGNRFIVKADADEVDNTDPARKLIESIDIAKLATLK
jgi:hypothetical protein